MSIHTHKAIATTAKGVIEEIQVSTPEPEEFGVLVEVQYSSLVAYDTYTVDSGAAVTTWPLVLGLNAAGTVAKVGPKVENLKAGDRVITFARGDEFQAKSMQKYALLQKYSVAKIPAHLAFPEAATIPDNFVTAYFVLFDSFRLPIPSSIPATSPPPESNTPILIYGSGTTVGQHLIQLLRLAGYTRILTTASAKHHQYLRGLGASDVFDYSSPDLSKQILSLTEGKPIKYAVDCVSAETTLQAVAQVVGEGSIVSLLLPIKEGNAVAAGPGGQMWMEVPEDRNPFSKGVEIVGTKTFTYQENAILKETLMPHVLPQLLTKGLIQPNRVRLFEGGTLMERTEIALQLLRENKISGEKVIVRID